MLVRNLDDSSSKDENSNKNREVEDDRDGKIEGYIKDEVCTKYINSVREIFNIPVECDTIKEVIRQKCKKEKNLEQCLIIRTYLEKTKSDYAKRITKEGKDKIDEYVDTIEKSLKEYLQSEKGFEEFIKPILLWRPKLWQEWQEMKKNNINYHNDHKEEKLDKFLVDFCNLVDYKKIDDEDYNQYFKLSSIISTKGPKEIVDKCFVFKNEVIDKTTEDNLYEIAVGYMTEEYNNYILRKYVREEKDTYEVSSSNYKNNILNIGTDLDCENIIQYDKNGDNNWVLLHNVITNEDKCFHNIPGFEDRLKQLVYGNSKEEKRDVKFRFYAFTTNEHSPKLINNRYFNSSKYFGAGPERYDLGNEQGKEESNIDVFKLYEDILFKNYDRLPDGFEQFPIFQTLRDHKQKMR